MIGHVLHDEDIIDTEDVDSIHAFCGELVIFADVSWEVCVAWSGEGSGNTDLGNDRRN